MAMGHTNPSSEAVASSKVEPNNIPPVPKPTAQAPPKQPAAHTTPIKIPMNAQAAQAQMQNLPMTPEVSSTVVFEFTMALSNPKKDW